MSKFQKCIWCIIAMVISFLPGIFGVFFTPHGDSDIWYSSLVRSGLTPPGLLFSVAWTLWYLLLGLALYLIIKSKKQIKTKISSYVLFGLQLLLNAGWTYLFFGLHMTGLALFVLMVLIILSAWMARVFHGINKWAAYCVIPYILWMLFAFYLNSYIVLMN